jgi:hypothetical protein
VGISKGLRVRLNQRKIRINNYSFREISYWKNKIIMRLSMSQNTLDYIKPQKAISKTKCSRKALPL